MSIVGACRHPNEPGLRFCTECGASLATCPSCSLPTKPEQRFCGHCGTGLAATPAPPAREGERKQVTVLFADVVGSMVLAERLDADELTELMQGLFAVCRDAVQAFGGTVDKFTGDGIMALFGAPVAQEDHARRACHAALRLVERARTYSLTLPQDLAVAVRVGLNSGEVVAGSVGEAFTAVGQTVGLAQRMESLAEPGTVRVSRHTADLAGPGVRLRDLGPTPVKGLSLPVQVFALDGVAGGSAAAGRGRPGGATLVGRHDELDVLRDALDAARAGRAQIVGLIGEAGAGKSRLCEELVQLALADGILVRRAAGVSHAQSIPLLPILGLLRDFFEVEDADVAEAVRAKVADRLLDLDPAFESDLGLLFDFLEVPDPLQAAPQLGPEVRRTRVLQIFRRITERRNARQTALFVFEDLHWFDGHSVRFLGEWLAAFTDTRTLIVTNCRPEFQAPWATRSTYRQLSLGPLSDAAVAELFAGLLGPDPSVRGLAEQLQGRAGGNPFFAEEIVRSLAADGTLAGGPGVYRLAGPSAQLRIPATVQAVLAERIDRLDASDKSVLRSASVVGRTFSDGLLSVVRGESRASIGQALARLCAVELLQATGTEGEYRFWHPLTQEVAYRTLLGSTRRALHRAVAEALIAQDPQRHDELAALVVTHFEAADEDVEAARWQLRAAGRAVRGDLAEAHVRWRSVVEHLAGRDATPDVLALGVRARMAMLRFGARTGMHAAEADRLFGEARPAAERLGDPALLAGLSQAAGAVLWHNGECAASLASFLEFHRRAEQVGDLALRAFAWATPAALHLYTGPLPAGLAMAEAATNLCADDPLLGVAQVGYSVKDLLYLIRTLLLTPAGQLAEADLQCRTALDLFGQRPMTEWRSWTLSQFAVLADYTGEPHRIPEAGECAAAARRLAEESGNVGATVKAGLAEGVVALLSGSPDKAAATFADVVEHARRRRAGLMYEPDLYSYLTRAHLELGDAASARASAEEAVAVARRQGARVGECHAQLVRAAAHRRFAVDESDLVLARTAVAAGEALARETGAETFAARLAEERARLDGGDLHSVAETYDAIGAIGHARRLREELQ